MNTFLESTAAPKCICLVITPSEGQFIAPEACFAWEQMLGRVLGLALREKGLLRIHPPCQQNEFALGEESCFVECLMVNTIGWFEVTNFKEGLAVLRAEVVNLGLLPLTQIAWLDTREHVWRYYYPAEGSGYFDIYPKMLISWIKLKAQKAAAQKPSSP